MSWTEAERRELAALYAEQDRLMAEHDRRPAGRPPASKTSEAGVVYKEYQSALQPAAADDGDWSGWEAWLRGHLDGEREVFTEALTYVAEHLQREHDAELAERDQRIAKLEAKLETLTALLAPKSKLWTP